MDCKDSGHFIVQDDVTLCFMDGPCPQPPLPKWLAELDKVCSMNPQQIVSLVSFRSSATVADANSNAWLTVSIEGPNVAKTTLVALTVCRVRINGHCFGADTVDEFPVFLKDINASYSFVLRCEIASPVWNRLPSFSQSPFSMPLLSVSLTGPGIRRIEKCSEDGHGQSSYRDVLTDFIIMYTCQKQALEFGKGHMSQPECKDTGSGYDELNLIYVYRPGSGDECLLSIPRSPFVPRSMAQCLGLPAESCVISNIDSETHNVDYYDKHDSGWFNIEWDGMIRKRLLEWIPSVLTDIVFSYIGSHIVPIEPRGAMVQRCRDFDAFCNACRYPLDGAWYEWAMVAASMAESVGDDVAYWLNAFATSEGGKDYLIAFGGNTASEPIAKFVAVMAGVMQFRGGWRHDMIELLIGTRVDTHGYDLPFEGCITIKRRVAAADMKKRKAL